MARRAAAPVRFWRRLLLAALGASFVFGVEPMVGLLIYIVPAASVIRLLWPGAGPSNSRASSV